MVTKDVQLSFHPLTQHRWADFEKLFGDKGACGGCWCMSWRLEKKDFEKGKGTDNKRAMKKIVNAGEIPGILAYDGSTAIGWCSVAPRKAFPRLEKAPTLKRIDDTPIWSVVCFYIAKEYRRKGVSEQLLKAAVEYVKKQGGRILEGYPYEVKRDKPLLPGAFVWTGLVPAFKKAGFKVAKRRSQTRPIMRYYI